MKNSTTLLLPKWFDILEDLTLSERIMPRDVTTRWNSTYDMLDFAIEYQKAVQLTTGDLDLDLRKYELTREQWMMAEHLRDVLKVRVLTNISFSSLIQSYRFLRTRQRSSRSQSPTSTVSSPPWITSIFNSTTAPSIQSTRNPSRPLSASARRRSIGITT